MSLRIICEKMIDGNACTVCSRTVIKRASLMSGAWVWQYSSIERQVSYVFNKLFLSCPDSGDISYPWERSVK